MNNWFKRNSIHLLIGAIFFVICFIYFAPAFQGKTLGQMDVVGAQSTQKEINDYRDKGITILWTNQIFGGMPTFQIWAPYPDNITTHIVSALKAIFPNPIDTVLILLFGTYFLFTVLKLNPWLAAAGAVAFTFSSYNIILLVAGHSNQAFAIAFFAPLIASILLILQGKYLTGSALTALFLAMEIRANHVQMTYYLMLALLILFGIELYHAIKAKTTPLFFKSLAYLAGAVVLAVAINASLLWSTAEYAKYSYRGKSNLTKNTKEPSSGLDKDYAYEWSQGVTECFTFLVPNAYSFGSGPSTLDQNSNTAKLFLAKGATEEQAVGTAQQIVSTFPGLQLYWGRKPGTAGPFYFGAVVCFLFLFGLLIVKNRLKWWLLGTVILTMLLSFGGNFPYVSDLFFKYFPLYNKFRAVESILAVTSICFPILAFMAVQEIINSTDKEAIFKKLKLAFYITGGLLVILIAVPGIFLSFKPDDFQQGITYLSQAVKGDTALATSVANAIVSDRESLERTDAIRSLIFVLLAFGITWAFIKKKITVLVFSVGLLVLTLVDIWPVDKRYLKDANFADKLDNQVKPREVDSFIARDKDPDFRVFDLTANIKFDQFNGFFHKSISGYSAARLKRFDELIDGQLAQNPPNHDVLDMLNTKYFITTSKSQDDITMTANPTACGHAWFVKSIKYAKNSDEEMQAISSFSPKDEAIVDKRYKGQINEKLPLGGDTTATITLTKYSPDTLIYQSGSTTNQVAVFSEIYYEKGWTMYVDGVEKPYFRADYVLRAAQIPVGNHEIKFIFHPVSYYAGEKISLVGSILLILALAGATYTGIKKRQTEPEKKTTPVTEPPKKTAPKKSNPKK
ncbi:MAG TPA: YfhO family protein [Mucilaginibacter sp.]|nr:YfhO family protein [Mucilaginibacter sp.]